MSDPKKFPLHDETQGEFDKRTTWDKGQLQVFGPDGQPVDTTKEHPPTLHIYPGDIGEGDDTVEEG